MLSKLIPVIATFVSYIVMHDKNGLKRISGTLTHSFLLKNKFETNILITIFHLLTLQGHMCHFFVFFGFMAGSSEVICLGI